MKCDCKRFHFTTQENALHGFPTVPFVSQVQLLTVSARSATCVSLHSFSIQRRYKILLSPLRPSSLCAPSPPPARLFGPHQHCLLLRAVRPWPGAFRFLRSAHGPSLPEIQHKNFRYFVSLQTWGARMKAWSQLIVSQLWFILTCKQRLQNERKKAWSLTFAATSALISSWVSARRFLASSVLRSHSAMNDSRWSTAFRRKKPKNRVKALSLQLTWNHWSWQQEAITHIKLKEQVSLLRGDFIICPKCQVMNLSAFS